MTRTEAQDQAGEMKLPGSSHSSRHDRASQAYERLRVLIVRGRLAPGSRIVESDIAKRLGVSRTPVRSALQRLEQEGYVVADDTGKQTRMAVAPLTVGDARELFDIVGQLEGLAARSATRFAEADRDTLVRDLREINDALAKAAEQQPPDHAALFELDDSFHRGYVEAGAGARLRGMHDATKPQADRYIHGYIGALSEEIGVTIEEHALIVDAIESGDPTGAQQAVTTNWQNARDRLLRIIRAVGERGRW